MAKRNAIVQYCNEYLEVDQFHQADPSNNGLQVEGSENVKHIVSAVDACMETFEKTVAIGGDMLIVHHGLYWGHTPMVTGIHRQRLACLLANNVSLYASHLPLDAHMELGNNAQLADMFNLKVVRPFGNFRGCSIGVEAAATRSIHRDTFAKKVEKALSFSVHLLPFGPEKIKKIAIVSGGGGSEIARAARKGFDLLLTGEGSQPNYHEAKEHGINVLYAGHYATETVGVIALAEHLKKKFKVKHTYIDVPTGF